MVLALGAGVVITYTHVSGDQYTAHVNGTDVPVTKSRERAYQDAPWCQNGGRPHLAMYEAAIGFLGKEPLRVIDFACGSGYGSAALAAAGHTVTAADVSEEAIAFARAAYGLEFAVADIGEPWPWRDGSHDAVVSVESIEHTPNYRAALIEMSRVLRPGGVAVISTPQGSQWKPVGDFHVREFTMMELAELISESGFAAQAWVPADAWLVLARVAG